MEPECGNEHAVIFSIKWYPISNTKQQAFNHIEVTKILGFDTIEINQALS